VNIEILMNVLAFSEDTNARLSLAGDQHMPLRTDETIQTAAETRFVKLAFDFLVVVDNEDPGIVVDIAIISDMLAVGRNLGLRLKLLWSLTCDVMAMLLFEGRIVGRFRASTGERSSVLQSSPSSSAVLSYTDLKTIFDVL